MPTLARVFMVYLETLLELIEDQEDLQLPIGFDYTLISIFFFQVIMMHQEYSVWDTYTQISRRNHYTIRRPPYLHALVSCHRAPSFCSSLLTIRSPSWS